MAVEIFKRILKEAGAGPEWRVESAGTWALEGAPISSGTGKVMKRRGIDLSNYRSRNVNRELIQSFDLILTMESGHKEALRAEFPEVAQRVFQLSEMSGHTHDIYDPTGGPIEGYEETWAELTKLLIQGFEKINQLAQAGLHATG